MIFRVFGILPIFKELFVNDDAYHEYRVALYKKTNSQSVSTKFGLSNELSVADVDLAKFLLGLPPHIAEKGGITFEIFMCDPHGFQGGLLLDEGETWQVHRKELSKILHLEILEHYLEPMDIAAVTFTEKLCETNDYQVRLKTPLFR